MSRVPLNHGNVPLFVRFLAKIPNGTAAESPCYSVFWNAIDFCRLYTSKKNLNVGPANRPAFYRQVPLFHAKCPSKNIIQVGRSVGLLVRYRIFHLMCRLLPRCRCWSWGELTDVMTSTYSIHLPVCFTKLSP